MKLHVMILNMIMRCRMHGANDTSRTYEVPLMMMIERMMALTMLKPKIATLVTKRIVMMETTIT